MNPWAAIKTITLVREVVSLAVDGVDALKHGFAYLFDDEDDVVEEPKKRASRKKPDTTKLTQVHFDFIMRARQDFKDYNRANPKNRKTLDDLTQVINQHLGMDKSTRAYARVWNGEIDRNDLAVGNAAVLQRGSHEKL